MLRATSLDYTVKTSAEQEPVPGFSGLNKSLLLPAPDTEDNSLSESKNESSIYKYGADFLQGVADTVFRD